MREFFVIAAVLTAFSQLSLPALEACGAKFLVATKSTRLQREQMVARPANILMFQHSDDEGVAEFYQALGQFLASSGHHVALATTEDDLREVAGAERFDMVMTELETARRLRVDLESWTSGAEILPMAKVVTTSVAARARQEFGQVLQVPAKDTDVLSAIEDTVGD